MSAGMPPAQLSGPVVPVWLAPWPGGGEVLLLPRESLRALAALGATLASAPATPTIAILSHDVGAADGPAIATAARDLVRRAVATTVVHHLPAAIDGTRHRIAQLLVATGVLLLAFRPGVEFEHAVQVAVSLWLVAAVPALRRAWRRSITAVARDRIDALRLALGAEVDRRSTSAMPPVFVAHQPALATLVARLDPATTPRDAARIARDLGLAGLAACYEADGRSPSVSGGMWIPAPRPTIPVPADIASPDLPDTGPTGDVAATPADDLSLAASVAPSAVPFLETVRGIDTLPDTPPLPDASPVTDAPPVADAPPVTDAPPATDTPPHA